MRFICFRPIFSPKWTNFTCFRPFFGPFWINFGLNRTKRWSETGKSHLHIPDLEIFQSAPQQFFRVQLWWMSYSFAEKIFPRMSAKKHISTYFFHKIDCYTQFCYTLGSPRKKNELEWPFCLIIPFSWRYQKSLMVIASKKLSWYWIRPQYLARSGNVYKEIFEEIIDF